MFGFILTTLTTLLMLATLVNCQSNDTGQADHQPPVWCPKHLKVVADEYGPYRHCEPDICMNRTVTQQNDSQRLCLDDYLEEVLHGHMTNKSCQWVRLRQDKHFHLNLIDGSMYEMKTNLTYKWGDYVYLEHLQEAIICREKLLPGDDTHHITLWCHSHTIELTEPPQIQDDGAFHFPKLDLTVDKGFYHVHNDSLVDVCLELDLELMRCEHIGLPDQNHDPFHLQDDLSYLVKWKNGHKVYPVGHYYLSADHTTLLVCLVVTVPFHDYLYPLYITSAVFLSLTLLAHLFYPKLNYHAKALVCHVSSMMVMYICMAVHRFHFTVESTAGRFALFAVYYVSAMSTYLWLSVIAYDVWKVFTNLRGSSGGVGSQMDTKRWFVVKCLYAWGIPLFVCVLVIGLSHDQGAAQHLQLHMVNNKTSFFDAYDSTLTFVYGPMAVILVVNLIFFTLTICNIRRASQMTSTISRRLSKKLFYLSLKLFVVMGISWVADVVSFMVKGYVDDRAFYWSDVINGLQGVAIFVVYVCKKSTWWMIKRRCLGADDVSSETKSTETARGRLASVDSVSNGGSRKQSNAKNGSRNQSNAEIALVDYNHA